jgi:hypothetical protein
MRLRIFLLLSAVVALLVAGVPLAAPKKGKPLDKIWVHPQFSSFGIQKIALLPIATYDNSLEAEKTIEQALGQAFKPSGHRWSSAVSTRDQLRARAGGSDSLVRAVKAAILKSERVDSLEAGRLSALLRVDAVMAVRADQWERQILDATQSGRPFTQVLMRATLVDSSGVMLWSASGSERGEGAYQAANTAPDGSTIEKAIPGQGGAPMFFDVLQPLFTRWAAEFPKAVPDTAAAR